MFYHHPSKQFYSSAQNMLNRTLVFGPLFNLSYDGSIFFNTYRNNANVHFPPTFPLHSIVYVKLSISPNNYTAAEVVGVPLKSNPDYTLHIPYTSNIFIMPSSCILAHNQNPTPHDTLQDTWADLPSPVKPHTPATLFHSFYANTDVRYFDHNSIRSVALLPGRGGF